MSLVQKIPSMVSALAFGYGVGMAAPESAISPVRATVVAPQASLALPLSPATAPLAAAPVTRIAAGGIGGNESRELMRLRVVEAREGQLGRGAEACDLDRPTYTKAPRYESRPDHETFDPDDLDTAGAEALSKLQLPDLRVPVTRRTVKYVRFFTRTERGRGMFETWLKRSGKFQELIQTELREHRMPEDLMWVAMIESGFDPRAKSPAGAVGLWQFMPATGDVYGLEQDRYLDQRKNPRLATKAAAHHLHDLYMRFGSWDLALAAYNMGYEQLLDAIDTYGTADFNELGAAAGDPLRDGGVRPEDRRRRDRRQQPRALRLRQGGAGAPRRRGGDRRAAGHAAPHPGQGRGRGHLRGAHPQPRRPRGARPPGHGDYLVYVPADTVSRARAALPAMLENEPLVGNDASILNGVDLLKGRELALRRVRSDDDNLLSLLPHPRRHGSLRAPLDDDDGSVARDDDDPSPLLDNDADGPRRFLGHRSRRHRETVVYRVGPGDTIAAVAQQFGIAAQDVARQNKLDDGDKLKTGTLLKLKIRPGSLDDLAAGEGGARDKDEKASRPRSRREGHRKGRDAT